MIKRWAVIEGTTVINVVVADRDMHETHGGDAWIDITGMDPSPQPGWIYIDGEFTPPVE